MIARFLEPSGDKHYSFQMVSDMLPTQGDFLVAMKLVNVQKVKPFLQGYSNNWAMVEFWTKDEEASLIAAKALAEHFKSELLIGEFTRSELGL
jgi:hypothetical protein